MVSVMDVVTARPTELDRYAALARTTGIIGIAFLVLLFGPIIALASADEPALEATAAEAVKYFGNLEATWAQLTMAASTLGMIGSLWFFVASDLRARPIYHHKRDSIEAHLTIVFAALAVTRWLERRTDWSIKKLVTSLRRYHTIEIQAGDQIVTAADPLPNHIRATLQQLHGSE
jgi:hypothetical protein